MKPCEENFGFIVRRRESKKKCCLDENNDTKE
jgi:hypothetical protein